MNDDDDADADHGDDGVGEGGTVCIRYSGSIDERS